MYNGIYPAGLSQYNPQIYRRNTQKALPEKKDTSIVQRKEESETGQGSSYAPKVKEPEKKVNIKQIVIDFENTLSAIGAPEVTENEVKGYLGLVEKQADKEEPSKKIIVSNLRNASEILDSYISEALNKPSNVVKDWIDALLLQPIDYKLDKTVTAGFIEANHPEISTKRIAEKQKLNKTENTAKPENTETTDTAAPLAQTEQIQATKAQIDPNIQRAIDEAKQLVQNGKAQKALGTFAQAMTYAKKIDDKSAQVEIFLNVADIQDEQSHLSESLKCLNNAAKISFKAGDTEQRAKAHKAMGKIYDEVGQYNAAMNHYFAALSLDGQNENLKSQAEVLNNVGTMQVLKYEYQKGLDYFKTGFGLAKEVKEVPLMGTLMSNTAGVFKNTGDNTKAMKYYKNSVVLDKQAGKTEDIAITYEQAGDIMFGMNKTKKALDFYKKSYKIAEKHTDNKDFLNKIAEKIDNLEFASVAP